MKMILEKPNGSTKGASAFRRSRGAKKRGALFASKDFWRVLSSAALSSPHTPVLRRLHD
jgi:hypothetical protein